MSENIPTQINISSENFSAKINYYYYMNFVLHLDILFQYHYSH